MGLVVLAVVLVLGVALASLAYLQRRLVRDQARQVEELLREARRIADEAPDHEQDAPPGP